MYTQLLKQEQYFHVRIVDGISCVEGQHHCLIGHVINGVSGHEREGIFVDWEWDGTTFRIKTDKFAFYPVYYWRGNQEFIIATSILKLFELGASKELDYEGLAVFLRLGFFIGEQTAFKDVKALPPDADLKWSQGQLSLKSQIKIEKVNKIKRDEAIDQYIHLFKRSIEKRSPENSEFVVPLSGGRDSRHILLELIKQGHMPKFAVTHEQYAGKSLGEDVSVATALCQELGIKHVCLEQSEKYSRIELKKNLHTNFCSDKHQQMYVLADYIADNADIIYEGIAGDTLSEGQLRFRASFNFYQEQQYEELATDSFRRFSCEEIYFRRIFHAQFYAKINIDKAVASLVLELKKYKDAADPFSAFIFWNRTRRDIALLPFRVLERTRTVHTPYLDYELYSFLSSLPADLLNDQRFHTDTIHRAYPEYAQVPFENEGPQKIHADRDKKLAEINKEVAFYYIAQFKLGEYVWNQKYMLPRMLGCQVSSRYAESLKWLPMPRVFFLTQLGNLLN